MKVLGVSLLLLLVFGVWARGQQTLKTLVAISDWKRVNTLPFFEPKPEPVKEVVVQKEQVVAPKVAEVAVVANTLSFKPAQEVKINAQELETAKPLYFDSQNRLTKPENAYFYRKAQFDERTNQPKGAVEDFYTNGDKPKFKGAYDRYNSADEERNNKYDGTCEFYAEDGAKIIRTYNNGRSTYETRFNSSGRTVAQALFNIDGKTRKEFIEYLFDKSGVEIGNVRGRYNTSTGLEESKQVITQNGKVYSIIDFAGNCPTNKATFYTESGQEYGAIFQDFTCVPDLSGWKFSNGSDFQPTHKQENKQYLIRSTQEQVGFLHLPVAYDFYKKEFEIDATFEQITTGSMAEVGIVWQYKDPQNYAHFKVNTVKSIFEIDALEEGESMKFMAGVNPSLGAIMDGPLKLSVKKSGGRFKYTVNGQPIKIPESKFPLLDDESKTWNIGFFFKASKPNQSIVLKHLTIKFI